MIQKLLSDILNKILGNFIYGLNDEQFGLSDLLSGKLELTNIHFKQSVIDLLDIPCRLNFGCVGYFKINLPLFYFMKNPINIYIEDVIIVLSTIPSKYWDDKLFKEKYIENKKNLLLSSEYRAIVCSVEGGVIWQMILSLINNIYISIKNVHIRIEDFTSNPSNCFSFGINIEELFLNLPKEGLPFKRDGYYTKKNELVNNTMINMITVKKLGFYMDYLNMKKMMNKKHYSQWNDIFMSNINNSDYEKKKIPRKKNRRCEKKFDLKSKKNIKSNEENLKDFQEIIKNIKDGFSEPHISEMGSTRINKINQKILELNEKILKINHNNKNDKNNENNYINSNKNNNNNKNANFSNFKGNFYNFYLFSKKGEKSVPILQDFNIDNDVSWISCIVKFSDSLENKLIKEKKEELLKKKKKKSRVNNNNNNDNNKVSFNDENIRIQNKGKNYINKAVSFFSISSFTNILNKNFLKRNNNNNHSNNGNNNIIDDNVNEGYFTTRESLSDPNFNNDPCMSKNKKKKKRIKKYVHLKNKKKDGEKYYDVIEDYENFNSNCYNYYLGKNDKIYLNFVSNEKNRKKEEKGNNNIVSYYENYIDLEDKKKEKIIEENRILKYIKKNEIKEKIRRKKRKKIDSVYLMYEKTYKINKTKLNSFFIFLQLIKNIKHDYIINPNFFEGYGEIYLSLIPTDHGELPFSRCFSSWGIQKRSEKEFEECLPKLSIYVTLKNMKIIFSDKQMFNTVKWLNLNFFTYSIWKAGILSQFEKSKANNEEEITYINKWVLKLLDTYNSKEEKIEVEKYCEEFENNHSIHIINLLRSKAFCKLQELKKEVELKNNNNIINQKESKNIENNNNKNNELKHVANESIHFLKNLMKNQKTYNKIKNSFREKIFTIDLCVDICITNSAFLLTVETYNTINNRKANFVKIYALLMQCLHYHNQISNTHELRNSIDVELYPLTLLLVTNNLENKYIKPDINVLYILTKADKKNYYENKHTNFLFKGANFEIIKKYKLLKRNYFNRKSRDENETLNFGNLREKLKFLTEENFFFSKRQNNMYCDELNDIMFYDPSLYLRYDNQSYTILEKPDHRLFLHNCAYSILNINTEIVNSFIDDYFHFTDRRAVLSKKKEKKFSFKKKEYFLELGAKYCNDILDNYTRHTNVFLDIELEKILSVIITKSGKSTEIQGYSLSLNPVKIMSKLSTRLKSYEGSTKNSLYDSFFVHFNGIKIKRILNWPQAAKNYNTYLDDNFIKPYHLLFLSQNKDFFLDKNRTPDKFSFNLSDKKNKEIKDGDNIKNKNIIINSNNSNNNSLNNCSDGNKSEIYGLRISKKNSYNTCSISEYNNRRKISVKRSSSCPCNNFNNLNLSRNDIEDKRSEKQNSNLNENSKQINLTNKKYNLFFFKSCLNPLQEEEEELKSDDFYKNYKNNWNSMTNIYGIDDIIFKNKKKNINDSNYVFTMSEKTFCSIELCHIKFNPIYPMFIIKINEEDLYINICDYDIEFFFLIFTDIYEHYTLQELTNKKKNILFLKKKIKSLSKLNSKYYKSKIIDNNGMSYNSYNLSILKKKSSHKKKVTNEKKRSDKKGKTKYLKKREKYEKCLTDKRATLKNNNLILDDIKKKKLLKKESSKSFNLEQNKETKMNNCIENVTKKVENMKKYHGSNKETFTRYLSDSNIGVNKTKLSISKYKNNSITNNSVKQFHEYDEYNISRKNNAYISFNCDGNKTKGKFSNSIMQNKKISETDNGNFHLNNDEKKSTLNRNISNIINLNEFSDSYLLNKRRVLMREENYYSNSSSLSYYIHNSYKKSKKKEGNKNKKTKRKKKKSKIKAAKTYENISSEDDSWVDLVENYESDESLDDFEKKKVKNMLNDIENIKKRLSNDNFTITCSFSFSIKKIFIRLWKRKSPLKQKNKYNDLKYFSSFHLLENLSNSENKNKFCENKTKLNSEFDEYKMDNENSCNVTSILKEQEMDILHCNKKNNIQGENEDSFFFNKNFITLNENLQKNMFNNMQNAFPLYTLIFSDIFFVAKVEKNSCAYVLYSIDNIDIRDETNITLLSMSSIYHSDLKIVKKSTFSNYEKLRNIAKLDNTSNKEKRNKIQSKNEYKLMETKDTFLNNCVYKIDLPDLEKTHLVLIYYGFLFKNNHSFKFILNKMKIKIFWEIIDEFVVWILNINDLLPKMHVIEKEIIRNLDESENKHLNCLQKIQQINYDILYFNTKSFSSSSVEGYKIPYNILINYYNLKFSIYGSDNTDYDKEENTIFHKREEEENEEFYIITNDKLYSNNNNIIFINNKTDINKTIKDILFNENYFFNYNFNKVNKNRNIGNILSGIDLKDVDSDNKNKYIEKKSSMKSARSLLHDSSFNKQKDTFIRKEQFFELCDNDLKKKELYDDLKDEENCSDCCHMMNLHYTSYTKELCKTKDYPYVHIDVEINYFEIWVSLDPIRIPQKKTNYLINNINKKHFLNGKKKKK